jgi:hypothetical protein
MNSRPTNPEPVFRASHQIINPPERAVMAIPPIIVIVYRDIVSSPSVVVLHGGDEPEAEKVTDGCFRE